MRQATEVQFETGNRLTLTRGRLNCVCRAFQQSTATGSIPISSVPAHWKWRGPCIGAFSVLALEPPQSGLFQAILVHERRQRHSIELPPVLRKERARNRAVELARAAQRSDAYVYERRDGAVQEC